MPLDAFSSVPTPELRRRIYAAQRLMRVRDAEQHLLPYAQLVRPSLQHPEDVTKSEYRVARHHEVIAHALEGLDSGTYKNLILTLPPRHGKSELASRTFIPWYAGRNPGKSLIFATYNEDIAADFGSDVADVMDSRGHMQTFPRVYARAGQRSADHIGLSAGGDLFFIGRGGGLTSRGGDGLILDDPFKDDAEAGSKHLRDKAWSWFTKTFLSRRMTDDAWVVVIQTRWHEDDITGRLTDPKNEHYSERLARGWHIIDLPALAVDDDDPMGRQPGEPLWPERFNRNYLLQMKDTDPGGFQALYQGRPAPDEGLFYNIEDLHEYGPGDRPETEELSIYMAADYAVGTEQANDRSAIIVFGVDGAGRIWIFPESFVGRLASDRAVETTIGLIKKFKPLFLWGEKGQISKSLAPFLRARMREEGAYTTLVDLTTARDKRTKAQSSKGRAAQGLMRFPRNASWWGEVKEELLSFPKGKHDDFADALSFVGMGLDTISQGRGVMPKANEHEPGTFGHMMRQAKETQTATTGSRRYW